MPRTATTFLQRNVFPQLPGINYYGPPYTHINEHFNCMQFEDNSTFDRAAWQAEVNSLGGDNILISNENFVGQSLFWHFGNRTRIAQRLHSAMPDATVILFLRNQGDLLRSLYLLALQESETRSMNDYFVGKTKSYNLETYFSKPAVDLYEYAPFDTYHAKERLRGFDYLPLIELYKSLFPRVEVLLFEDFKKSPSATLYRLAQIFGVELPESLLVKWASAPAVNSSTGQTQASNLRRLNLWRPALYTTAAGRAFYVRAKRFILNKIPPGKPVIWSDQEHSMIREYYSKQNTELNKRFPHFGLGNHARKYHIE